MAIPTHVPFLTVFILPTFFSSQILKTQHANQTLMLRVAQSMKQAYRIKRHITHRGPAFKNTTKAMTNTAMIHRSRFSDTEGILSSHVLIERE